MVIETAFVCNHCLNSSRNHYEVFVENMDDIRLWIYLPSEKELVCE